MDANDAVWLVQCHRHPGSYCRALARRSAAPTEDERVHIVANDDRVVCPVACVGGSGHTAALPHAIDPRF